MILLLSVITSICYAFALKFEIFEGGSDNFIHYRVSRYAFKYPGLFLDHWGKPFFTLVSAPFAQFGFKGFIFFNVLCGVLASFFTWKVAEKLKLSHTWMGMVLVLTMPIYYIMMVSVMTEILFSLVLILSIYFILQERYILAAILFSSLFLIRTEGYILYPFVAFVFAWKRQWIAIPFLGFFFLLYSIIGWFYFGDFLWLINQIPYGDTSELYGTGELLFFAKQYKLIFGRWAGIFMAIGILLAGIQFLMLIWKERKLKTDFILIEVLLLVYFAAHSYVWWSGTGASAGLIRVMAAIIPLAALSAVRTVDFISQKSPLPKFYVRVLMILFSIYLIRVPFKTWPLPFKYGEREKTIVAAVDWMQNSKYANTKIYFYEPLIYHLLDRDPFDHSVIKELVDDHDYPENVTKPGELIFYDMHFGPNEGGLPLKNLMQNPRFKLVNYFEPLESFKVLGNYDYAVLIFERVMENKEDNESLLEKYKKSKTKKELWKRIVSKEKKISKDEFTLILEIKAEEMEGVLESQILSAEMEYRYQTEGNELFGVESYLVISIEKDGEAIVYKAEPMETRYNNHDEKIITEAVLTEKLKGNETIKIYIWSKTKQAGIIKSLDVYKISKSY